MQIAPIQFNLRNNYNVSNLQQNQPSAPVADAEQNLMSVPLRNNYNVNVNFRAFSDPNRMVADMEFENYSSASNWTKRRYRKLYKDFYENRYIDKSQLFNPENVQLPLRSEKAMDEFIKTSRVYLKYKDQPIICLGRSPKWFLNAALWMKDGIDDYTFVAFSKAWYKPDYRGGVKYVESEAPNKKEIQAYRKYLKRVKADPQTIVDNMEKTGKRTVITDYICSGKGACSFLDVMSNYANDLGILDKFAKSIQIVGIGSMEYLEERDPGADEILVPRVPMPPLLKPYTQDIPQNFYDMDYMMFNEMLLNKNTNECRSTYYPHEAWTVYKPDTFKTGMVKDMKKVKAKLKNLKNNQQYMTTFTPAMCDYRNLLNFRILDSLSARKLLKEVHHTKF